MSASSKVWPLRDDYQKVVLDPRQNIRDPRLHSMRVEMKKMGAFDVPFSRNGNFGAVYKFSDQWQAYALKVFADSQPDREQRYAMIHRHLASYPPARSLVSFSYTPSGIRVRGSWYPTLVMDWAEGDTLRIYLRNIFEGGAQANNGQLCRAWAQVMRELNERRMAHGDLQHGNILVMADGSMKLVDYDGIFVPEMRQAGMTATEFGMAAYQHPKRYRGYFDERLDDFAGLVILLSLACVNRARWQQCHQDDSYLLVKEADLLRPEQSALLNELAASSDAPVKKLAVMLKRAAQADIEAIPSFASIIADQTIRQVFDPTWRPTDRTSSTRQASPPISPPGPSSQSLARCAACHEPLKPGDQFCRKCGRSISAPLPQRPVNTPQPEAARKCPHCRADLIPGDQFCRLCGRSLSGNLPNLYAPAQSQPVQPNSASVKEKSSTGVKIANFVYTLVLVLMLLWFIMAVVVFLVKQAISK